MGPSRRTLAGLGVLAAGANALTLDRPPLALGADADDADADDADREETRRFDYIWAQMRHLYPGSPMQRPAQLESYSDFKMYRSGEGELGVGAAGLAQVACSNYFNGRDWESIMANEVDFWRRKLVAEEAELVLHEEDKTVTCRCRNTTATYKWMGKRYGCLHVSQVDDAGLPIKLWSDWPAKETSLLSDEKFEAVIDELSASRPSNVDDVWTNDDVEIPEAVQTFVDAVFAEGQTYAAVASWKGKLIERYSEAHKVNESTRLHGWSMSKSVLSLLVATRESQKKLNREDLSRCTDAVFKKERELNLESMLNMRIGMPLDEDTQGASLIWGVPDTAAFAVNGTGNDFTDKAFKYSGGTISLASRELRYSFPDGPEGFAEYARYPWEALFSKIGADSFVCEMDQAGTFLFSSFCYASAKDWLKIGELVKNYGKWPATGEQLINENLNRDYVEHFKGGSNPHFTHSWYRLDVLYQYGTDMPIIAARGIGGQVLVICPTLDFVFVRLGKEDTRIFDDRVGGKGLFKTLILSLERTGHAVTTTKQWWRVPRKEED